MGCPELFLAKFDFESGKGRQFCHDPPPRPEKNGACCYCAYNLCNLTYFVLQPRSVCRSLLSSISVWKTTYPSSLCTSLSTNLMSCVQWLLAAENSSSCVYRVCELGTALLSAARLKPQMQKHHVHCMLATRAMRVVAAAPVEASCDLRLSMQPGYAQSIGWEPKGCFFFGVREHLAKFGNV